MIHTLQVALEGMLTPERVELLTAAVELIEQSGRTTPIDELQEIIEIQDGMSNTDILVSRINDVITLALDDILLQFGIELIEDAELQIKIAILRAITSLEFYIIPEHIVALLGGYFNNEEIIAHLVPFFSNVRTEEAFDVLVNVDANLITRIETTINEALLRRGDLTEELPRDNSARIGMLNRLITQVGRENISCTINLIEAGVRAGRPFSSLLGQVIEDLDGFETIRATSELMALVIFSDKPLLELGDSMPALINEFTDDYSKQRLMELTFNKLFSKLSTTP